MKPGYKTTEFWSVITAQAVAMLVAFGVIAPDKAAGVEAHVASAVGGMLALIALFSMVKAYIESRTELKMPPQGGDPAANAVAEEVRASNSSPKLPMFFLALGLWLLGSSVQAQQPCPCGCVVTGKCDCKQCDCCQAKVKPAVTVAAFLPWRDRMERDLRDERERNARLMEQLIAAQRQQPAPVQPAPQIIMIPYGGPQQQLPIGGPPQQQLPIGGPPQQQLPIPGPPQQQLPIPGPPQQQLPQPGPPQQGLPLYGGPQQRLPDAGQSRPFPPQGEVRPNPAPPPGEARPQQLPTGQPQRYTPAIYVRR